MGELGNSGEILDLFSRTYYQIFSRNNWNWDKINAIIKRQMFANVECFGWEFCSNITISGWEITYVGVSCLVEWTCGESR